MTFLQMIKMVHGAKTLGNIALFDMFTGQQMPMYNVYRMHLNSTDWK